MFRHLLALLVLLVPLDALACGWFFPSVLTSSTTMEAQRVLMVWKKDTVDVHVSVRASDANADFAWVLPVADDPTIALGDATLLDALDSLSNPIINIASEETAGLPGSSGACAGDSMDRAGANFANGSQTAPVQVTSGTLGNYEYDIVKAETAEEMIAWLTDDGYVVPEDAAQRLAPYVAASMSFVWVKLSASADIDALTDLQPLILTVPRNINSIMSFPLALSAASASDIMNTRFFVLADKRYRVTNYPSTDLQAVADRVWELRFELESYESIVDRMTDESGGRLIVTELAGDLREHPDLDPQIAELINDDTYYLTRLSARTRAENLRDATITFAHDAPPVSNVAVAQAPADGDNDASVPFVVLATLLGLLGWRRHRETPAHHP